MFRIWFFILIIAVPAAEIGVLLWSGKQIGVPLTVLLIILTGILGTYLARSQGMKIINQARQQLNYGQMPGDAVLDGVCILIGGTMLLSPGFLSDVFGILLLLPLTRKFFKRWLALAIKRWINKGNVKIIR
ncbi:FxsA family protein [Bacillus sp. FJAT-18017]|uniref:FxsA family protein n=1 Tax=Bacillus sp. FJAT-18017 TaxID=1705566 RepID=UPI000A827A7F|nr:FxsA family protein [Bacillus sp. FJAT-18017]